MAKKSKRANPAKAGTCDLCELRLRSVITGAKHRRCGGSAGKPIRPKYAAVSGPRGYWR
jgi:hypothetical protein